MPTFDFENKYPNKIVCGIDEAGLGPLAGPLVVACVVIGQDLPDEFLKHIDDSKKLSPKKRENAFAILVDQCNIRHSIAIIEPQEIDSSGLSAAWQSGIISALQTIEAKIDVCLLDGNKKPKYENCLIETIVKGDQKSYSIASASIIAKVTRDRIMQEVHKEFPQYGFNKNVGYGTKFHAEQLKIHGFCRQHRQSYAPVSQARKNFENHI